MNACRALLVLVLIGSGAGLALGADRLGEFIPTVPPQPAPTFDFTDTAGQSFNLAAFKGKLVLVNLWATWCQPCIDEMPALDNLQKTFGNRLTVLAISQDRGGTKVVQPFIDKLGLETLKIYLDPKNRGAQAFNARGLPTSILIDEAGHMRGWVEGSADWDGAEMLEVIRQFLPAPEESPTIKSSYR